MYLRPILTYTVYIMHRVRRILWTVKMFYMVLKNGPKNNNTNIIYSTTTNVESSVFSP